MFSTILAVCFALNAESLAIEAADKAPAKVDAAAAKVQPSPASNCAGNSCCNTKGKTVVRSSNNCGNKCASSCGSNCGKLVKRNSSSCRSGLFNGRLLGSRGCR